MGLGTNAEVGRLRRGYRDIYLKDPKYPAEKAGDILSLWGLGKIWPITMEPCGGFSSIWRMLETIVSRGPHLSLSPGFEPKAYLVRMSFPRRLWLLGAGPSLRGSWP